MWRSWLAGGEMDRIVIGNVFLSGGFQIPFSFRFFSLFFCWFLLFGFFLSFWLGTVLGCSW